MTKYQSLHPYPCFSRIVLIEGLSHILGRSQILCVFTKKGTNRQLIIAGQPSSYLFLEKSLKQLFSIQFVSILRRMIYFVLISQGSDLLIHVNINFSQQYMRFLNLFDCNPPKDVRGIFLDLSKAFDRVWHDGFTGNSLNLLKVF